MNFKNGKSALALAALGLAVALVGCKSPAKEVAGTETAAQGEIKVTEPAREAAPPKATRTPTPDELEVIGDLAEASRTPTPDELEVIGDLAELEKAKQGGSSEQKPQLEWRRPQAYILASKGPESIAAAFQKKLEITPENALAVQQQVVDEISAIGISFDGFDGQLDPETRQNFEIEMRPFGQAVSLEACKTNEELAKTLIEFREAYTGVAKKLVSLRAKVSDDFFIKPGESFGAINKDSNEESIKAHYGAGNYKREERFVSADNKVTVGVLFPGVEEKELVIVWEPNAIGEKVSMVTVPQGSKKSHWKTVEGLGIGTTLHTCNQMNGKPFKLVGMEQEHAGQVVGWEDGRLTGLSVALSHTIDEERFNHLKAPYITSDAKLIEVLNPTVYSLGLSF